MNKGIPGGMDWSVSELRDAGGDLASLERYQTEFDPGGQFVHRVCGLDRAFPCVGVQDRHTISPIVRKSASSRDDLSGCEVSVSIECLATNGRRMRDRQRPVEADQ